MQRFNQAWLLDPNNPYTYLGFAILLNKDEKKCKAMIMFMQAHKKGLQESGFLADYAQTSSACALSKEKTQQAELFNDANDLHAQATQTPNKQIRAYAYQSWAKSYFLQDDFVNSQAMLEESKKLGGKIDTAFENSLNEKIKGHILK